MGGGSVQSRPHPLRPSISTLVRALKMLPIAPSSVAAVAAMQRRPGTAARASDAVPRGVRTRAVADDATGPTRCATRWEGSACDDRPVVSRRGFVALPAFATATWVARDAFALADEEEELDEDAAQAEIEASMKSVLEVNSGEQSYPRQTAFTDAPGIMQSSFEVSSLWEVSPVTSNVAASSSAGAKSTATWGGIVDPVNGKVVTGATVFVTKGFSVASIDALGKPENVSVAKALGLDGDDSYRRADMLGSAKRVGKDGQVYYDWEMVASPPPKQCPSAVGCLYPEHIYLMSATVRDGDLYVLSLDAFPENWRQAGNSLRRMRGSFDVSPAPVVTSVPAGEDVDTA